MRMLLIPLSLLLVGCGGGSDGSGSGSGGTSGTNPVTTYYQGTGRLKESGFFVAGATIPTGGWVKKFDQDGDAKYWEGSYVNGNVDHTKPWTEWNADGSIRVDWTDR